MTNLSDILRNHLKEKLARDEVVASMTVRLIRSILEQLSFEIATPDEARDILALKGGDNVKF